MNEAASEKTLFCVPCVFCDVFFFSSWKARLLVFPHEPSDRSFHRHFSYRGRVIVSMSVLQALDGINANAKAQTVYLSSHVLVGPFSSTMLGGKMQLGDIYLWQCVWGIYPTQYRGQFCNIFHLGLLFFYLLSKQVWLCPLTLWALSE